MDSAARYIESLRQHVQHQCNVMVWRLLCSFEEKELVLEDHVPYVRLRGRCASDMLLLPVRPLSCGDTWFHCPAELKEFYTVFGGLRERPPSYWGSFFTASYTPQLRVLCPCTSETEVFSARATLPVVFASVCGDVVVMNLEAQFEWFDHEEGAFTPAGNSAATFITSYVKHRLAHDGHPFDSHGRTG